MPPSPLRVVSDDDLLLVEVQRSPDKWKPFYKRFKPYVAGIARKLARATGADERDVEDAVQSTYLLVIDPARPRYEADRSSAQTYLFYAVQTALHAVVGIRRRRRQVSATEDVMMEPRFVAATGRMEGSSEPHEEFETRVFVTYVLDELTDEERVIYIDAANDRTLQDIADEKGVSRSTMSRTVAALRVRVHRRATLALAV